MPRRKPLSVGVYLYLLSIISFIIYLICKDTDSLQEKQYPKNKLLNVIQKLIAPEIAANFNR